MDLLPYGEVPPREHFLSRVHGPYEIILDDEDAIYIVTGAINQGFDSEMVSIGAEGRWLVGHGMSLTISNPSGLYSLVCRLIDIERDHGNGAGALAHDILSHFGYGWSMPETVMEVADGESESESEGSFQEER